MISLLEGALSAAQLAASASDMAGSARLGFTGLLARVIKRGPVTVDARDFAVACSNAFQHSRKSREAFLKTQARGVVRTLLAVTPPGSKSVQGIAAKKRGEAAVMRDALRVFAPVRKGYTKDVNIDAVWQQARGRDGRVKKRTRNAPRIPVKSTEFNRAVRARQKHVGRLAHGWYAAAKRLGVRVGGWIANHSTADGDYSVVHASQDRTKIVLVNDVRYASDVKNFRRRVEWAVNGQILAMRRSGNFMVQKKAEEAGFSVN
jgi:hypothetical protein